MSTSHPSTLSDKNTELHTALSSALQKQSTTMNGSGPIALLSKLAHGNPHIKDQLKIIG
jgi:hypothetical protein